MSEMAWESRTEEVMAVIGDHMAVMDEEIIARSLRGNGMYTGPWRTRLAGDITCADLTMNPFLLGSPRIAMLREAVGIALSAIV